MHAPQIQDRSLAACRQVNPFLPALLSSLLLLLAIPLSAGNLPHPTRRPAQTIVVARDASPLERLAAREVQRYVYLRTGLLLPVKTSGAGRVIISTKSHPATGRLGHDLAPQEFRLQTTLTDTGKVWWVIGGDDLGTLYGAYRLAEKLGVRFGLDEDALPDTPLTGEWPDMNETARPRFARRGLQPFHDFSVGPDWWNLHDYESVLTQMAKLRMNTIAFHTYPSWNAAAGPEANVWIGLPEDVDPRGNVKFGYEAGVVTTRRGWEVRPFPTGRYAAGAGLLFPRDDYGPDFMPADGHWPKTAEASAAMFNRYGDLQQQAFTLARRLGIKTALGTEIPLGIPPQLAERLRARGLDPADPAVIQRLYEGTFLRLQRKMPLDDYWLWIPEIWLTKPPGSTGWEMASAENVERDFRLAGAAARAVQAPFGLATCGWRLGTREDASWTDQRTPKTWAVSSINTSLGQDPVEPRYGAITGRPKWAIGWAEDDGTAGANCCTCLDLQLWVRRMFRDSADASRYGCDGMMAIHWRTAAMAPNLTALTQAGWTFEQPHAQPEPGLLPAILLTNADSRVPEVAAALDAYWADWGRGQFGGEAGAAAGRLLQRFDEAHLAINDLFQAQTTDEQFDRIFAPLRELEALRPQVQGVSALARFDYWLEMIRATRARAETWVLSARLGLKVKEAEARPDDEARRQFAREQLLPRRLAVARKHEDTIGHFVRAAKSPGEAGAIAHIEYGVRELIVSGHDAALARLLGGPLPPESAVRSAYRGAPRIYVSSTRTLGRVGQPHELRPFVLSSSPCAGVQLFWRPLGRSQFKKAAARHEARQAYRVELPAKGSDTVEYYLEATLADGGKVRWPATAPKVNQTVVVW